MASGALRLDDLHLPADGLVQGWGGGRRAFAAVRPSPPRRVLGSWQGDVNGGSWLRMDNYSPPRESSSSMGKMRATQVCFNCIALWAPELKLSNYSGLGSRMSRLIIIIEEKTVSEIPRKATILREMAWRPDRLAPVASSWKSWLSFGENGLTSAPDLAIHCADCPKSKVCQLRRGIQTVRSKLCT